MKRLVLALALLFAMSLSAAPASAQPEDPGICGEPVCP
jgi:hypothetical protein